MIARALLAAVAVLLMTVSAEARRVALVIGQDAYASLSTLSNPRLDAARMAAILVKHGFEVIACDGKTPGCFDQTHDGLLNALGKLEAAAKGADTALVFFAGHGMENADGNVLAPVDATINCATWQIARAVPIERFLAAIAPARHKIVILDACRNNPMGEVCPPIKGARKLSFRDIKVPDASDFLLVTSTKPGQEAEDGLPGTHSPFARALFVALEASPEMYFDQVFNRVAKAVIEATAKTDFTQIPEFLTRGGAPETCLKGIGCVGDVRAAALAQEVETLKAERARDQELGETARAFLAEMEKARGKPLSEEERKRALEELRSVGRDLAARKDTRGERALERMKAGDATEAEKLFAEVLEAQEKEAAETVARAAEKKREAAKAARNIAVLARGKDAAKAADYLKRATAFDPADAQTWLDYAEVAREVGHTDEAKAAFEQAVLKAQDAGDAKLRYWAMLGLGDVALAQGGLASALQLYQSAAALAEPIAKSNPGSASWQRDFSVSHERIGNVLVAQGNLGGALASYRALLAIAEDLAKADPGHVDWQRDLSVAHDRVADVLVAQGNLGEALQNYQVSLTIAEGLAKSNPGHVGWQRDLSVSQNKVGDVLFTQGNLGGALASYRTSLVIRNRLAKSDRGNAGWQRDLSFSLGKVGDVLAAQGIPAEALESYQASLAISERLAKSDPDNAGWQRDLSVLHGKVGNMLVAQGNLGEALESYRAMLVISERLAKSDPSNARWQRDLSAPYEKIGDVLFVQGNLPAALASHRASLAIREHLAKSAPGNAGLQRDLSTSQSKVGDVLTAQGSLPAALESHRAALVIRERLAKSAPGNAGLQRDLALSHGGVAMVLARQGQKVQALAAFKRGREIIVKLRALSPDNSSLPKDLAWFDGEIAALEK